MSKIEWTDRSDWNPIRGCTRVSEGCRNCYAEAIAARFSGPGKPFDGFAEKTANGSRWTGKIALVEDRLTLPLKWRKPSKIFVNSASDLFHESIPDEWIDRVFAVMALAPQHTFQVLTKRPARMRAYVEAIYADRARFSKWATRGADFARQAKKSREAPPCWPLPNVWLGVTAEDQQRADERREDLRAVAKTGWTTFVSYEPALGPVDWGRWYFVRQIICGGESGPGARPMHPDWARDTRDFCALHRIAFFFKWGEWTDFLHTPCAWWNGLSDAERARVPQQFIAGKAMNRIGRSRAGRLLDGREWNQFPETMR